MGKQETSIRREFSYSTCLNLLFHFMDRDMEKERKMRITVTLGKWPNS
jgi:hypothetical protein